MLLHNEPEAPPQEVQTVWNGDGEVSYTHDSHFELTFDKMDDTYISGYLEVSNEDKMTHESAFEGTGAVTENTVIYTSSRKRAGYVHYLRGYCIERSALRQT